MTASLVFVVLGAGTAVAARASAHGTKKRPATVASPTPTPAASPTTSPAPSPVQATSPSPSPVQTSAPAPASPLFSDDFESAPAGSWQQGATVGNWLVQFNGFGTIGVETDGTHVVAEAPQASTSAGETHAGLVTSSAVFGDADITVRARTVRQLRTPTPNAWEVPWILWDYGDNTHFYYVCLKPNGWELGKEDPAYPGAQRFLATGGAQFPVGPWYTVRIRQAAGVVTVWANGVQLASFTDTERPYRSGSIGLYNEDSHVRFDDVVVNAP